MKKNTLLMLLENIYEDADYMNCIPIKKKVQVLIEKISKEGVEDDGK
jgi:hypothetical protein